MIMEKDWKQWNAIVETVLDGMEAKAAKLGIPGVAVVLYQETGQAGDLRSVMRVVGGINTIAEDKSGYNFIALAYSKLAESIETRKNSGNPTRPLLVGEFGYQGSAVAHVGDGLLIASFSGKTTGDVDLKISEAGLEALQNSIEK